MTFHGGWVRPGVSEVEIKILIIGEIYEISKFY